MINLQDHVVIRQGIEYVPLDVAQKALSEAYEFNKYKEKLDEAMAEFQNALSDINSLTEDIDD